MIHFVIIIVILDFMGCHYETMNNGYVPSFPDNDYPVCLNHELIKSSWALFTITFPYPS